MLKSRCSLFTVVFLGGLVFPCAAQRFTIPTIPDFPVFSSSGKAFGQLAGLGCTGAGDPHFSGFSVLSMDMGVQTPSTTAVGSAAGRPYFPDIHINKPLDDCTPLMFAQLASGKHIATATITVLDGSNNQLFVVALKEVFLTSQQLAESGGGISENLSLAFGQITMTHVPSGKTSGWDVLANKALP